MKRAIVLFVASILILTFSQSAYCKDIDPKKQAEKFVTAVQTGDFQTVFNMSYHHALHVTALKAETPGFLFQKEYSKYYEKSRAAFGNGDPYFPKECHWKIIEIKRTKEHVSFIKGLTDVYLVYAYVTYDSVTPSPLEIRSPIKETAIELHFLPNGLFVESKIIPNATVLWSLPVRIYDAKYEYGVNNVNPALIISFSVDGGNSQWVGGKAPYKYSVVINNVDLDSFVSKYNGYSQALEENNLQKTIILTLDNRDRSAPDLRSEDEIKASFRWPKGFSSPVNVKIQITDSSNPVKSDSCILKIEALAASEESVQNKAQGAVNKLKGIMGF